MRQPSPSHYGSWPRIFGFVLKEAESRLACSSCLYLQERGQGGPLFLDDTEKKFLPPPRSGSATELCQLRVLIREKTWEITLKYLSEALLSNALNNKNELKSVRLNKFSKTTLVIPFWIVFVPPFVFAVPVFVPSFNVLSANYFSCYTQVGGSTHCLNFDKFYGTGHDTLQFSCLMAQTNKEVFILTPKLKNEIGYSPLLQSGRVALRNNKN